MNAKEMFEELGYEADKYNDKIELIFRKKVPHGEWEIVLTNDSACKYFKVDSDNFEMWGLLPKEIQAIHQQMIELGWLDKEEQ